MVPKTAENFRCLCTGASPPPLALVREKVRLGLEGVRAFMSMVLVRTMFARVHARVCVPLHARACKCKGMTGSTACWKPTLVCLRACVLGNARAPMGVCVCAYGRVGGLCLPVPFCARLCKRMCSSVGARPCARSRVRAYSSGEKGLGRDSKKPLHFKNSTFHSTLPCPAFTVLFRQFPHVVRRDHPSVHVPGRRLHRRQRHRRRGAADASDCSLAHRSQEHVRVTWTWCTVRVLCGCASDYSGGLTAEHLRREIPRRELWAEAQRKGAAVDGERGAEHERFAVLYYNGRHAAPRRQTRGVRPGHLGVQRRREDGEGGHVCRRAAVAHFSSQGGKGTPLRGNVSCKALRGAARRSIRAAQASRRRLSKLSTAARWRRNRTYEH